MPAYTTRKIFKIGASSATTHPKDWCTIFNLKSGDEVEVFYNALVIIKPKSLKLDRDFLKKEFEILLSTMPMEGQGNEVTVSRKLLRL